MQGVLIISLNATNFLNKTWNSWHTRQFLKVSARTFFHMENYRVCHDIILLILRRIFLNAINFKIIEYVMSWDGYRYKHIFFKLFAHPLRWISIFSRYIFTFFIAHAPTREFFYSQFLAILEQTHSFDNHPLSLVNAFYYFSYLTIALSSVLRASLWKVMTVKKVRNEFH